MSDSFLGTIWKTGPGGGVATAWVTDGTLTTNGIPPFGANGLAFNNGGTALFVANTGNDTVVKIPVTHGIAGQPAVFANSINGADGLAIDKQDNVWVCANQSDEIVILDPTGPKGLLFPASLAFGGEFLYVTNLALDLRLFGLAQSLDSQWTQQVSSYTVSRIRAHIPPIQGLP